MRRCPLCHRSPREDDPTQEARVRGADGGVSLYAGVCTPCAREAAGLPPQALKVWRVGEGLPYSPDPGSSHPEVQRFIRVCGVCRLALRGDDPGGLVRLPEGNPSGVEAGCYSACRECIDANRDAVLDHWVERGFIKPETRPAFAGSYDLT